MFSSVYPRSIAVVTIEGKDIEGKIPYVLNLIRSLQDLIFFNFGGTILIQWQTCELISFSVRRDGLQCVENDINV